MPRSPVLAPEERRLRRRGTAAPLNSQPVRMPRADRPDLDACPAGDPAPTVTPQGQTNSDASVEDGWWLVDAVPGRPRPCLASSDRLRLTVTFHSHSYSINTPLTEAAEQAVETGELSIALHRHHRR